jgi:galactonate dehydratase
MKITDLKILMVNRFMYVKIYTDEGLSGLGECGAWGYLDAAAAAAEIFKDYLSGAVIIIIASILTATIGRGL